MKTKDHVVPKSKGGTWTVDACLICNGAKADMSLEQFRQKRGGIEFYGEMCARQEDEKTRWIYDFSEENGTVPSLTETPSRPIHTPREYLKNIKGLPQLWGYKFGGFTVVEYICNGRWEVVCMCGTKEVRTTRAVRNPANTFDACVECRKPIGKLRSDYFKATGKNVSWEVCFQYLYENSARQV